MDWLCLDGYNQLPNGVPWNTFSQVFQPTYNEIVTTISSGKPIMVAETASCANSNGVNQRGTWISQMQTNAPALFPNITAISYYNSVIGGGFNYDADTPSLSVFTAPAASPNWQGPPF